MLAQYVVKLGTLQMCKSSETISENSIQSSITGSWCEICKKKNSNILYSCHGINQSDVRFEGNVHPKIKNAYLPNNLDCFGDSTG